MIKTINFRVAILAPLVCCLFLGCSTTQSIINGTTILEADTDTPTYIGGKKFATLHGKDASIRSATNYVTDDKVSLIVTLKNTSKKSLQVFPEHFFLNFNRQKIAATDPERKMESLNSAIEAGNSSLSTSGPTPVDDTLQVVGLGISIASLFADEKTRDKISQDNERDRAKKENEAQMERDQEVATQSRISNLREQRAYIENNFLRKNTLKPGSVLKGLVEFYIAEFNEENVPKPYDPSIELISLAVDLGTDKFNIPFKMMRK